ncbi:hypothetical protein VZT92_010680 [Zoarces viviparus]|uniref:Uncharacterized protein n=1 Tax=Zoarces viviparus TaxID=48416 RepID=A0AAW1F936_ZOAVI
MFPAFVPLRRIGLQPVLISEKFSQCHLLHGLRLTPSPHVPARVRTSCCLLRTISTHYDSIHTDQTSLLI